MPFLFFGMSAVFAQEQTYEDVADSVQYWMEERVANATEGIHEVVEMPFVVRSLGWGCLCPDHYIGVSPFTQEGPFIHPVSPANFPVSDRDGHSLVVTGFFTGKWVEEDYRDENGEPEEWLYKLPEFKILSWRRNEMDYEIFPPRIIENPE